MAYLTKETVRRFLKRAGAKRVSDKAAEELAKVLDERAKALASEAKKLAEHSKRRTVLRRDVKMAKKNLLRFPNGVQIGRITWMLER